MHKRKNELPSLRVLLTAVACILLGFGGFSLAFGIVHYEEDPFMHSNFLVFMIVGAVLALLGITAIVARVRLKKINI